MIQKALEVLPNNKGTKAEIFAKITELFNVNLDNQDSALYRTLSQALCKKFGKTVQEYGLNMTEVEESDYKALKNPSMKKMIEAALLQMPNNRGAIKEIKNEVSELFGHTQALKDSAWE
jgi:hypothetical protein